MEFILLHKILRYDMFYLWYVYFSRILVNHADAGSIGYGYILGAKDENTVKRRHNPHILLIY